MTCLDIFIIGPIIVIIKIVLLELLEKLLGSLLTMNNNMNNNKNFLSTAPIGKLLFKLAVPTLAAQLINMLYNIVDRIYIGHIPKEGALALTGVGVCMPIIMIVSAFAALVGYGGAPRASIFMGKNDNESAEKTLGNCFFLQILISLVLTALLLIFFYLLKVSSWLLEPAKTQLSMLFHT